MAVKAVEQQAQKIQHVMKRQRRNWRLNNCKKKNTRSEDLEKKTPAMGKRLILSWGGGLWGQFQQPREKRIRKEKQGLVALTRYDYATVCWPSAGAKTKEKGSEEGPYQPVGKKTIRDTQSDRDAVKGRRVDRIRKGGLGRMVIQACAWKEPSWYRGELQQRKWRTSEVSKGLKRGKDRSKSEMDLTKEMRWEVLHAKTHTGGETERQHKKPHPRREVKAAGYSQKRGDRDGRIATAAIRGRSSVNWHERRGQRPVKSAERKKIRL